MGSEYYYLINISNRMGNGNRIVVIHWLVGIEMKLMMFMAVLKVQ